MPGNAHNLRDYSVKLRLKSDYIDYYDHHFDREGETYARMCRGGHSRKRALDLMSEMHLTVPPYGTVEQLYGRLPGFCQSKWVIHTDLHAHCGEGKKLVTAEEALAKHRHDFAVEYVEPSPHGVSKSSRYLQIGNRAFWLTYSSDDEWRSNCGDVTILTLGESEPSIAGFAPLLAVDFVFDRGGWMYAVDLNTAPGLLGTGIQDILKPADVVRLIKDHYPKCRKAAA